MAVDAAAIGEVRDGFADGAGLSNDPQSRLADDSLVDGGAQCVEEHALQRSVFRRRLSCVSFGDGTVAVQLRVALVALAGVTQHVGGDVAVPGGRVGGDACPGEGDQLSRASALRLPAMRASRTRPGTSA